MTYTFGPYRADRAAYRVTLEGRALDLTPKLLDLLFYLLERPGTLVTKEELLDGVWPDANVTDNALAQAVSELREALGDSASAPTYIRTVARRGYRFIAPVEQDAPGGGAGSPEPAPATAASRGAIAVLDFTNVTGDADVDWLSSGIAETVSSDLAKLGHFRVVDRWRVRQTALATASVHDLGSALGVPLVATGSYQRSGPHLRISARIIDLASGQAVADAKVDGRVDDVFSLQDGIVFTLARELGIPVPPRAARAHETSSLEAYRAYTEGWLTIETLDTGRVREAIEAFSRAIHADPDFAQAFAGLANAEFVAHEMSRQAREPDRQALAAGIEHAEHAIHLAPGLAEGHATLSFLLASAGRYDEAQSAARRAVALEPDNWRHQYRLGHANWGSERIRALERAVALYPQFSYARLEMAIVDVARGRLDAAAALVREGAAQQDLQRAAGMRFPGAGFHWLLGTLLAVDDHHEEAILEFNRELERVDRRRLYGPEYAVVAHYWRGHSELALGRPHDALASFEAVADCIESHPRGPLGEADAYRRLGDAQAANAALERARRAREHFAETSRASDASLMQAIEAACSGDARGAVAALERLIGQPPSPTGWTIPVEPAFRALRATPGFVQILTRLADRAR